MSEYAVMPMVDYQNICDAVREKTGKSDLITSGAMADEISGIEPVRYNTEGYLYAANVVVPAAVTELPQNIYAIGGVKSIYAPEVIRLKGHYCFGKTWNQLERLICPKLTAWGGSYWNTGGNLKEVQAGSIGYPVTNMSNNNGFSNNNNKDLVITIYVDADTLADVPTDISNYQPFGAINATIVYRNSATGEVLAE